MAGRIAVYTDESFMYDAPREGRLTLISALFSVILTVCIIGLIVCLIELHRNNRHVLGAPALHDRRH